MSGVQGVAGAAKPLAATKVAPAATGSGFSVSSGATATGSAAAASVAATSLAGLLSLQEAGGEAVADREARRRGHDLLAELAGLQRDLLADGPDTERLQRLGALLQAMPAAADPRLRAVMDEVTLRVRIEIARYATIG